MPLIDRILAKGGPSWGPSPHLHDLRMKRWPMVLLFLCPLILCAQEICNNGIDDDGDGLIDLNDPDCPCSTLLVQDSVQSYIRNHSFEERFCCPLGFVSPASPPYLDCATGWHQATVATSDYLHTCGFAPAGMPMPPPDGQGAAGFQVVQGMPYFEYIGTCLTYPPPAHILLAGTTYTLSLWIAGAVSDNHLAQTAAEGQSLYLFPDPLPLAIYGRADGCESFPIGTMDCIGHAPDWQELGRVMVQPAWDWVRVSITFTPAQNIHSVIIGSACDAPASFGSHTIRTEQGIMKPVFAYFLIDDLMLTLGGAQVLSPTSATGSLCAGNVVATAQPPARAVGYQWYHDGVALPGQTSLTLDVSGGDYGPGLYTMAMDFNGACLMGSAPVAPATGPAPYPALAPASGCAPLTVAFADTSGAGTQTVLWTLGDGTTATDSAFTHTYATAGSYNVSLRVRNGAGCESDTLLTDAITVHPAVNGSITATPNPVDAEAPSVHLAGSGDGPILSWWWDLGPAEPPTSGEQNVAATFPSEPGNYPVMLVVGSAEGCIDTVRSVVTVVDPGVIVMPNVFSPNGDGENDRFIPVGYKGAPGTMEIYNRWGQVVFRTNNLVQGWSGTGAPDGTYFYIVAPDEPDAPALTGHVTLVR